MATYKTQTRHCVYVRREEIESAIRDSLQEIGDPVPPGYADLRVHMGPDGLLGLRFEWVEDSTPCD